MNDNEDVTSDYAQFRTFCKIRQMYNNPIIEDDYIVNLLEEYEGYEGYTKILNDIIYLQTTIVMLDARIYGIFGYVNKNCPKYQILYNKRYSNVNTHYFKLNYLTANSLIMYEGSYEEYTKEVERIFDMIENEIEAGMKYDIIMTEPLQEFWLTRSIILSDIFNNLDHIERCKRSGNIYVYDMYR